MEDGSFVCHSFLEDTDGYNWTTASMSGHCSSHTSYTWWWQTWRGWNPSPSLSDTEESRAVYWLVGVIFIIVCLETPDDYDDTIVEDEDHPEDRQAAWWLDWSNIVTETPDDDATDDTTKEDGDLTDRQWLWCSLCHNVYVCPYLRHTDTCWTLVLRHWSHCTLAQWLISCLSYSSHGTALTLFQTDQTRTSSRDGI